MISDDQTGRWSFARHEKPVWQICLEVFRQALTQILLALDLYLLATGDAGRCSSLFRCPCRGRRVSALVKFSIWAPKVGINCRISLKFSEGVPKIRINLGKKEVGRGMIRAGFMVKNRNAGGGG